MTQKTRPGRGGVAGEEVKQMMLSQMRKQELTLTKGPSKETGGEIRVRGDRGLSKMPQERNSYSQMPLKGNFSCSTSSGCPETIPSSFSFQNPYNSLLGISQHPLRHPPPPDRRLLHKPLPAPPPHPAPSPQGFPSPPLSSAPPRNRMQRKMLEVPMAGPGA